MFPVRSTGSTKPCRPSAPAGALAGGSGWFFNPRWELEAEALFCARRRGKQQAPPDRGRPDQLLCWSAELQLPCLQLWGLVGAGIGGDGVDGHSDLILSPNVGIRFPISQDWHIRADVSMMFAPNPASSTFKFPAQPIGTNDGAAYLTNGEFRLGIAARQSRCNSCDSDSLYFGCIVRKSLHRSDLCHRNYRARVDNHVNGRVLFGLGWFRLGRFVRFIPYQVVGGFWRERVGC